ncbi:GDYXXLXY domain-containing protein [Bacillus salacetis]|uniref:GDYXXLXY domain-containing protein n=1 Tax=Bacillus salacetis TaxID=2315464 RepID=UPI003B9FE37C
MNGRIINLGYLLGISLVLASIFYFFASNWQGFDRMAKVGLSAGILIIFYLLSFLLSKIMVSKPFLSKWLLVCAGISFGISTGLLGQIYNSHADSYMLFAVWLIPVILLGLVTKYKPFYLLGYLLFHLAYYFYVFPSSYFIKWTEAQLLSLILLLIGINALLFGFFIRKRWDLPLIKYTSFSVTQLLLIYMAFSESFPTFGVLMNFLFLANAVAGLWFSLKVAFNRRLAAGFIVSLSVYLISKGFELIIYYAGEALFIFLLFFSVALVFAAINSIKYLNRVVKEHVIFQKAITVSVTIIATIFSVISIIGLTVLMFMGFPEVFLFCFALVALILPGILIPLSVQMPDVLKYVILLTGYSIASGTSLFSDNLLFKILLFIIAMVGIKLVRETGLKVIQFIVLNFALLSLLTEFLDAYHWVGLCMVAVNGAFYILNQTPGVRQTAIVAAFGFFISLTVVDTSPQLAYIFYNISFFLAATAALIFFRKNNHNEEFFIILIYWFSFIGYKYYDLMWDLLHKSILFMGVGILFLAFTILLDKGKDRSSHSENIVSKRWKALLGIMMLQAGFLGYQTIANETLIKEGETVKLELAPIDPRSLLQGDYVRLNYKISDHESFMNAGLPGEKIQLVLRPEGDIHSYSGIYKQRGKWNTDYEKQDKDIVINGVIGGDGRVIFGIESFFVEEGTGVNVENTAEYAIVKVADGGNALLVGLE